MFIDKRRQTYFNKWCNTSPEAIAMENREFEAAFPVFSLQSFSRKGRNPHTRADNKFLLDTALQFLSTQRWNTYIEAMNTWAQFLRHDPTLFQRYSMAQLIDNEHIVRPAVEEPLLVIEPGPRRNGLFRCRCGSNNTEFKGVQTRGADEALTYFIYCFDCGNAWRR